ncbi:hypothetical protein GCM10020001_049810 [Nonomuraea salmonea]
MTATPVTAAVSPELVEAVRVRLARTGVEPTAAQVAVALRAEKAVYGDAEILAVARALCADLIGAGPPGAAAGPPRRDGRPGQRP